MPRGEGMKKIKFIFLPMERAISRLEIGHFDRFGQHNSPCEDRRGRESNFV
jgi:hypothetical protein